jgi:hypothetical protein
MSLEPVIFSSLTSIMTITCAKIIVSIYESVKVSIFYAYKKGGNTDNYFFKIVKKYFSFICYKQCFTNLYLIFTVKC